MKRIMRCMTLCALTGAMMMITATGCGASASGSNQPINSLITDGQLPLPSVPADMRVPAQRAAYVIDHFWDAMDYADTTLTHDRAFVERNFVNYASVMPHVATTNDLIVSAEGLVKGFSTDSLAISILADIAMQYLMEPDSPVRYEEGFIPIAQALMKASALAEADRLRVQFNLEQAMQNRPGEQATDFGMTTRQGQSVTLSTLGKIGVNAPLRLLLIYDPDCHDCAVVIDELQTNPAITAAIAEGRLDVLAVYPEDDTALYAAGEGKIPSGWIDAIAPGLSSDEHYPLPSYPRLLLLDSTNRVVIKDPTPEQIAAKLTQD